MQILVKGDDVRSGRKPKARHGQLWLAQESMGSQKTAKIQILRNSWCLWACFRSLTKRLIYWKIGSCDSSSSFLLKLHFLDILEIFRLDMGQSSSNLLKKAFARWQHAFLSPCIMFYHTLDRACAEINQHRRVEMSSHTVAQWIECLPGVREVMDSSSVGDSDFFFAPCALASCWSIHLSHFITELIYWKINIYSLDIYQYLLFGSGISSIRQLSDLHWLSVERLISTNILKYVY